MPAASAASYLGAPPALPCPFIMHRCPPTYRPHSLAGWNPGELQELLAAFEVPVASISTVVEGIVHVRFLCFFLSLLCAPRARPPDCSLRTLPRLQLHKATSKSTEALTAWSRDALLRCETTLASFPMDREGLCARSSMRRSACSGLMPMSAAAAALSEQALWRPRPRRR